MTASGPGRSPENRASGAAAFYDAATQMIGGATMSAKDWRECSNPEELLVYWYEKGHDIGESERKMRLLAVACCRRIWHLLPEPQRLAVEAAERVAEGDTLPVDEEIRLADSVE